MKKFLLGLLVGIVVAGLTLVIIFFATLRLSDRKPSIADNSTVILKLEGEVPEQPPVALPIPFLEVQTPVTVRDVWQLLRRAGTDSRVKAVLFMPRGVDAGCAKLQELRQDLLAYRKSGKPLVAFLRNPGAREYYLATAADRIYMTPEDTLDIKGFRAEITFLKGGLDKLGVQMEVEHVGKYKDAGDMFTRNSMSPETKDVLNQILDQFYGDFTRTIAEGRKKSVDEVKGLIDQGPLMGPDALAKGLVDSLAFEDQVAGELKTRLKGGELQRISHRDYLSGLAGSEPSKHIALLVGEGEITRGSANDGPGSSGTMTAGGMLKQIRQVQDDSSIKGVILRIDSPGGDGVASDDILHAVKELSKKKPTVISMSDYAASGGYFVAMSGDPIVSYPNTLTGSIGVLFVKPNLHGLYDKLGVQRDGVSRGRYANLYSDYEPLNDDERAKLRQQIEAFYKGFVQRVADGRKRTYEQIEPLAQGRVWLGQQAKENGLIDELGGLDRAIELVKQKAQIPANENVALIAFPPRRSLLEVLMSRSDESTNIEAMLRRSTLLKRVPLRALSEGGMMKILPFSLDIH